MRARDTRRPRQTTRETHAKPSRALRAQGPLPLGMGARSAGGQSRTDRLTRLLEEWLAEARIRYTYAGE